MQYRPARALELLRAGSGRPDATFREGQEEAIRHIMGGDGRLLVVQKTGWGKSFVYFIVTKLLREAGMGCALLVSPLLALMRNQIAAAERMGVRAETINSDKPDLAFVIHYQAPGSVVAYYQQVGRAGRALDAAYGVLLSGQEETEIIDYFIGSAFPTRDEVQEILDALEEAPEGLSAPEIEGAVNISRGRIQKTIDLLSLESPPPIAKQGAKWQLTVANLSPAFWERAVRLTELRKAEQAQMQGYVKLSSGHMEFLIRALDGEPGNLSSPGLPPLPTEPDPALVREAIAFLRCTSLPIEARKRWPSGGLQHYGLSGRIDADLQAQPGRALCIWGDAGWGHVVRQGKYHRWALLGCVGGGLPKNDRRMEPAACPGVGDVHSFPTTSRLGA